ncbi:Hypothetical protein RY69_1172 [Bifidobacterium breve]|uniref:Uncharacterized protein n=1 Tax=Bifidobacterium breve DSM 20213 = JCM 1192 TaxID=518634 RepID=D4BNY1_BIFBR|nr:Hypothetical protein RY69_1172 [Bifidobacterium breve]EFE89368.1 hypothetical protein BIFBRE_03789 [Bifidobacterium breve DSM 20213 = JCM 1192]
MVDNRTFIHTLSTTRQAASWYPHLPVALASRYHQPTQWNHE